MRGHRLTTAHPPDDHGSPRARGLSCDVEFIDLANEWFERFVRVGRNGNPPSPKTVADIKWRLEHHLLPAFAWMRLSQITVREVDEFVHRKVDDGILSGVTINRLVSLLGRILEGPVKYGDIPTDPTRHAERAGTTKPTRVYLQRADHIQALLDAAGALDVEHGRRSTGWRRPLLAILVFAGLRISEAVNLRWCDLDLASGTLHVHGTKTDAAERTIDLLPILGDELWVYAASHRGTADQLMFPTSNTGRGRAGGKPHTTTNVRSRVLLPAIDEANTALTNSNLPPLPEGLTHHSLRRTFASILFAIGRDQTTCMDQMGHATAALTLQVYARRMASKDQEPERLKALVEGHVLARFGTEHDPVVA